MHGTKHIIECHCVLPQYREKSEIVYHKFVVFSVIDKSDTVIPGFAQCNNCATIHKVYDICKSEIVAGKDESAAVEKINDVAISLPIGLVELFQNYDLEISDYQYARFILENKIWDSIVVLSTESTDDDKTGKILRIVNENKFRVESFSRKEYL